MTHLHSLDSLQLDGAWVTIGSFDGVHLGHQAILGRLAAGAHAAGLPAAAITFFPHPARVLRNQNGPYYLTTPKARAEQMAALGIDYIITLPFDAPMASLSAYDFMHQVWQHLRLKHLWVGYDFALGHNREGNVQRLQEIGRQLHFEVDLMEPVLLEGQAVSSSAIRAALTEGDVAAAARQLGRWYNACGVVIRGDGRGRSLGFPTANVSFWPEQLLPKPGVYSTWAWLADRRIASVTNIGYRPTFENRPPEPRLEAHLLDFEEDIYGQELCIEFVAALRPEQRFSGPQELVQQIQKDSLHSREILNAIA